VNVIVSNNFEGFIFFSPNLNCRFWGQGGSVVWQEAALPMCYIVRKTTTRSMPRSQAGYLRTSWPLGAL